MHKQISTLQFTNTHLKLLFVFASLALGFGVFTPQIFQLSAYSLTLLIEHLASSAHLGLLIFMILP